MIDTINNKNQQIKVVVPQNKSYELELAIANLISNHFSGEQVKYQTNDSIKSIMRNAIKIMEENGNIHPDPFVPTNKLKFAQLIPFKLYKNINTFADQWYMKIIKGGVQHLITGSRYSDYRFSESSATQSGAVFVEMKTELMDR